MDMRESQAIHMKNVKQVRRFIGFAIYLRCVLLAVTKNSTIPPTYKLVCSIFQSYFHYNKEDGSQWNISMTIQNTDDFRR